VAIKVHGDLDRDSECHFEIIPGGITLERMVRASPVARREPALAIGFYNELKDVPPGHFKIVVYDESDLVTSSYPIPD
jgi:hypothetical protein